MIITVAQSTGVEGQPRLDPVKVANALLDMIEPGASSHARRIERDPWASYSFIKETHHHYRLDVTIEVIVPREVAP